ncbi:MAG: NAD-dependent epimerase/dehydratase family protein [Chthoniobacterales bacterium]
MELERVKRLMLPQGSSLGAAIRAMDAARCGIVLVVDEDERLVGVVTDGDARRAILSGIELSCPVDDVMGRNPIVLQEGEGRQAAVALLQSDRCRHFKSIILPSINKDGRPVNIYHSAELLHPGESETMSEAERPIHVLLIGGAGYIGSMATRALLADGYQVTILDSFLYGEEALDGVREHPRLEIIHGDTRHIDAIVPAIRKVQAVVHLAELVGDPLCASDAQTTLEINYLATSTIARACAHLQVNRFIYVSSCSVYGSSANPDKILDEESPLAPVSLYAKMKINSEQVILKMLNGNFSPCIFRLGTVFGLSYRPRFDLVVNTLTAKAVCDRKIDIFGGNQWRPHVHVKDVVQAIQAALHTPLEKIRGQVFNIIGANHKIDEVGEIVSGLIEGTELRRTGEAVDQRNYRVSAHKARELLGFVPSVKIPEGVCEMADAIRKGEIKDYRAKKYHNVQAFEREIEQ